MNRSFERGMLLLPVALMLVISGAVAYAMTREGSMSVAAIDARYEVEKARYLADAGVSLAVWQNARRTCSTPISFAPFAMGGGTVSVDENDPVDDVSGGSRLAFTIVASVNGAVYRIARKDSDGIPFYDMSKKTTVTIKASDGNDTFIRDGLTNGQHSLKYLELSDAANANAHTLIKFPTGAIPKGAKVLRADLQMYLDLYSTVQSDPTLSAHRVMRDWPDGTTWTSPWSTPGGDYASNPEARIILARPGGAGTYAKTTQTLSITALTDAWVNKNVPNHGVLLKTAGMTGARYLSSDNDINRPLLVATYYPACT